MVILYNSILKRLLTVIIGPSVCSRLGYKQRPTTDQGAESKRVQNVEPYM